MRTWCCVVLCAFILAGCASGRPEATPPDASEPPAPDAPMLKRFGEPCDDRRECDTNICVVAETTSGQCSRVCPPDCPDGYGCVGVVGVEIEGELSYVCVPKCNPMLSDDPDPMYADRNCDGIDGDRMRAIFVASGGVNTMTCGKDAADPCQTISFGITRAVAEGRPHVYVQNGTYGGGLTMVDGISVFGGYNFNWKRGSYSTAGHTVTITGGVTAVRFNGITMPTVLDNVIVRSASATTTGGSSIGILVTSSQMVELRGVLVEPGGGGGGVDGTPGTVGDPGLGGAAGNPGCENSGAIGCDSCSRPPGGAGGTSSCGRTGGAGGQPGHELNGGFPGGAGVGGTLGGAGAGCGGSAFCDGSPGGNGANGVNGNPGAGGDAIGRFNGTAYVTADGGTATNATHGNGGGGGGGGGGGDDSCDSYGSSGGGGGAGGCGGTAGFPGSGGGGSFGIVALDSQLLISASIVTPGSGGQGGAGGIGGQGGLGGGGAGGGPYGGSGEQDDGGDGAAGGNGGQGGNGGRGGGGGGGPSISVVCLGTSASTVDAVGSTLSGGAGGPGGAPNGMGGSSAMSFGCSF